MNRIVTIVAAVLLVNNLIAQVVTFPPYFGAQGKHYKNCGIVSDQEGNTYRTVVIGNQCWMAENLRYLPSVVAYGTGANDIPYYYVHGYSGTDVDEAKATENYNSFGALYNWPAAMISCPSGWHLPSDAEIKQLEIYLGMTEAGANGDGFRGTNQGAALKSWGTDLWQSPNIATNSTGFSAIPGGNSANLQLHTHCILWTATENAASTAYMRTLIYFEARIHRASNGKSFGYSVRCVKD